jgi:hypothetical protein
LGRLNVRFHAIICFAPLTHLLASSAHQRGGFAGASFFVEVVPVTLHLWFCMYMFGCPPF